MALAIVDPESWTRVFSSQVFTDQSSLASIAPRRPLFQLDRVSGEFADNSMTDRKPPMRLAIFATLMVCSVVASALAQQSAPEVVPVGTTKVERKPIAQTINFVGRIDAINKVEVRARVTGYLEDVLFKEGEFVKEGQSLYRIEKNLFQAAVDQAAGVLDGEKAKKLLTAIQYQRAAELAKTSAGTVEARDRALTADRAADAQILISQANLDTANINLGYTDIISPITGKIGRTNITKGNVVSPQGGILTTIVSQDPMYVLFPVSQRDIMRARAANRSVDIEGIKVRLRFADGSSYDQIGKINFVDVTVDRATDTVQVRAAFPNPSGALIDGQLASVNLEAATPQEQVVVPQAALVTDQQGVYVFVVENGKVIVEGLQTLRPGMAVQARPASPTLN
jgi:membrane fusion protein (multidrug efflux system)